MNWNKKNQQFARSCGLCPSSIELAQYLLRRTDKFKPTEVLLDLREFNREIGKTRIRGEYDRKTVKEAIAQLDELTFGWFTITKSYTWAIHKILVRPVEYAIAKQSQKFGKAPKANRGNPMFDEQQKNASRELLLQNISKLDSFLKNLGLNYTQDNLVRLWRAGDKQISNIADAVKYMLRCHGDKIKQQFDVPLDEVEGIRSPKGWLYDCLRYGWHLVDETVSLPLFESENQISSFVDRLRCQT